MIIGTVKRWISMSSGRRRCWIPFQPFFAGLNGSVAALQRYLHVQSRWREKSFFREKNFGFKAQRRRHSQRNCGGNVQGTGGWGGGGGWNTFSMEPTGGKKQQNCSVFHEVVTRIKVLWLYSSLIFLFPPSGWSIQRVSTGQLLLLQRRCSSSKKKKCSGTISGSWKLWVNYSHRISDSKLTLKFWAVLKMNFNELTTQSLICLSENVSRHRH